MISVTIKITTCGLILRCGDTKVQLDILEEFFLINTIHGINQGRSRCKVRSFTHNSDLGRVMVIVVINEGLEITDFDLLLTTFALN